VLEITQSSTPVHLLDRAAAHAHSARPCTRNAEDFVGIRGLSDLVTV
jgi:hypothetical protein